MSTAVKNKSEILFLYESIFSIPNGDPFTGEQRYDDETKKILVSDVRIKRFIRDYLFEQKDEQGKNRYDLYVVNENSNGDNPDTAEKRFEKLTTKYKGYSSMDVLLNCIDVRMFGGLVTIKKKKAGKKGEMGEDEGEKVNSFSVTGPIQYALLNPSLNQIDLRMHQNTSVFASKEVNKQGAIGTTTVVPYAINQIHGWINPYSAVHTHLTDEDVKIMLEALWNSINNVNTRTKSNQNSLLLLKIVYSDPSKKLYGIDRLITIDTKDKKSEQLRSIDDYDFDLEKLIAAANSGAVSEILYHSEVEKINKALAGKSKFELMFTKDKGEK